MSHFGALAVAVADGTSGHAGRGDNADRDAVLQRQRGSGLRQRAPVCSMFAAASCARSPMITRSATSSPPARSPMLAQHWDGQSDRRADMGLRDLRIGDRYLLCADGPGPVVDDRTHFYVLTLRAISADALASSPAPAAGRASVSRLTPYRWARVCMRSKPAPGSRSLLRIRAADQPWYRVPRDARWHVRRHCRARCAGAYWRTIAVTMCPGKSGHK